MTKYTKGPWDIKFGHTSEHGQEYYAVGTDDRIVAKVRTINKDSTDARLIAAAPELLTALEIAAKLIGKAEADNAFKNCANPLCGKKGLQIIEAAISKAKGDL